MLGRDGDVLSKNSYIYVKNNPLKYTDPTGEIEEGLSLASISEWWDDLVVGVGNIVNDLVDSYPIIGTALDHPFITGPVMGVVGGVAIYTGAVVWEALFGSVGYTFTNTVANHLNDVVKNGENAGQLARPYLRSSLFIQEIMATGKSVPDAFIKGALKFMVSGTFRGSQGIWELVIDPKTKLISHFLFK